MEDKAFSSIDFVGQCLTDQERTEAFDKAIKKVVGSNSNVLDVGTGSGIQALFAARAGAKKVSAIEFDPYVAEIARKNFSNNNFDSIQLYESDARKIILEKGEKYDVVIMEMLTTGIVDEYQVQAINNLHKQGAVDGSTVFVPTKHDTFATLMEADYNFFGLRMTMVMHLWKWHDWSLFKRDVLSNEVTLSSITFDKPINENFEKTIDFKINKDGVVNSLYLTSKSFLTDEIILSDTESLNAPMIVPLQKKVAVNAGQSLKMVIRYTYGNGYRNFIAEII